MNLCTSSRCPLSLRPSLAYASTRFLILDGRNQLHRDHRVIIECKPIKIEEPLRFRHFHRNLRHYPHLARISQGYSVHFRTIEFGEPLKDHRKSMKIIETKIARICRRFIISIFLHFSWVSSCISLKETSATVGSTSWLAVPPAGFHHEISCAAVRMAALT